jgi:hypothetical protein
MKQLDVDETKEPQGKRAAVLAKLRGQGKHTIHSLRDRVAQMEAAVTAQKGEAYLKAIYEREGVSGYEDYSLQGLIARVAALSLEAAKSEGAQAAATAISRAANAHLATPAPGGSTLPVTPIAPAVNTPMPLTGQQRINGLRYLLKAESNPKEKQRLSERIRVEIAALNEPPAGATIESLKKLISDPRTSPREKSRLSAQIKTLWANRR